MASAVYSPSVSKATMQKAERLSDMLHTFHRGTDRQTGIRFYLVPGTEPMVAHRTTALYCSCAGFKRSSICSHQLACQIADQRVLAARIAAAQQRRSENGVCSQRGCCATALRLAGRCEAHTRVLVEV